MGITLSKECAHCHNQFQTSKGNPKQKFCKDECRRAFQDEQRKPKTHTLTCKQCQNKFESMRSWQVFCCQRCNTRWFNTHNNNCKKTSSVSPDGEKKIPTGPKVFDHTIVVAALDEFCDAIDESGGCVIDVQSKSKIPAPVFDVEWDALGMAYADACGFLKRKQKIAGTLELKECVDCGVITAFTGADEVKCAQCGGGDAEEICKRCANCGNEIHARQYNQRFCSDLCYRRWYQNGKSPRNIDKDRKTKCANSSCSNEVEYVKDRPRYCSSKCRSNAVNARRRENSPSLSFPEKVCLICRNTFKQKKTVQVCCGARQCTIRYSNQQRKDRQERADLMRNAIGMGIHRCLDGRPIEDGSVGELKELIESWPNCPPAEIKSAAAL